MITSGRIRSSRPFNPPSKFIFLPIWPHSFIFKSRCALIKSRRSVRLEKFPRKGVGKDISRAGKLWFDLHAIVFARDRDSSSSGFNELEFLFLGGDRLRITRKCVIIRRGWLHPLSNSIGSEIHPRKENWKFTFYVRNAYDPFDLSLTAAPWRIASIPRTFEIRSLAWGRAKKLSRVLVAFPSDFSPPIRPLDFEPWLEKFARLCARRRGRRRGNNTRDRSQNPEFRTAGTMDKINGKWRERWNQVPTDSGASITRGVLHNPSCGVASRRRIIGTFTIDRIRFVSPRTILRKKFFASARILITENESFDLIRVFKIRIERGI